MIIQLPIKKRLYICAVTLIFIFILSTGTSSAQFLSQSDMNNPVLLASEGWKKIGYGGWQWNLKDKIIISRLNSAETLFKKAIELDPGNADAYAGMARVIQLRGHISMMKFNKDACQKALDLIERAPVADTDKYHLWKLHYVKSETLLCLEDYDGAIREAEKMEEESFACPSYGLKSMSYYEKYKRNKNPLDKDMALYEGIDYLECAQSNDANSSYAPINLFFILKNTKDYNSTIEHFKNNLEINPISYWSYYNYVWVLLNRGDLDDLNEAEKTIKKAKQVINHDIDVMQLYSTRGRKYFDLQQYEKSFDDFNKLLSINALSVDKKTLLELCAKFSDGRCNDKWRKRIQKYIKLGDCKNALEEFNVNHNSNPQFFESLKNDIAECKSKK